MRLIGRPYGRIIGGLDYLNAWQKAEWVIKYEKAKEDLKARGRHGQSAPNGANQGKTAEVLGPF